MLSRTRTRRENISKTMETGLKTRESGYGAAGSYKRRGRDIRAAPALRPRQLKDLLPLKRPKKGAVSHIYKGFIWAIQTTKLTSMTKNVVISGKKTAAKNGGYEPNVPEVFYRADLGRGGWKSGNSTLPPPRRTNQPKEDETVASVGEETLAG